MYNAECAVPDEVSVVFCCGFSWFFPADVFLLNAPHICVYGWETWKLTIALINLRVWLLFRSVLSPPNTIRNELSSIAGSTHSFTHRQCSCFSSNAYNNINFLNDCSVPHLLLCHRSAHNKGHKRGQIKWIAHSHLCVRKLARVGKLLYYVHCARRCWHINA